MTQRGISGNLAIRTEWQTEISSLWILTQAGASQGNEGEQTAPVSLSFTLAFGGAENPVRVEGLVGTGVEEFDAACAAGLCKIAEEQGITIAGPNKRDQDPQPLAPAFIGIPRVKWPKKKKAPIWRQVPTFFNPVVHRRIAIVVSVTFALIFSAQCTIFIATLVQDIRSGSIKPSDVQTAVTGNCKQNPEMVDQQIDSIRLVGVVHTRNFFLEHDGCQLGKAILDADRVLLEWEPADNKSYFTSVARFAHEQGKQVYWIDPRRADRDHRMGMLMAIEFVLPLCIAFVAPFFYIQRFGVWRWSWKSIAALAIATIVFGAAERLDGLMSLYAEFSHQDLPERNDYSYAVDGRTIGMMEAAYSFKDLGTVRTVAIVGNAHATLWKAYKQNPTLLTRKIDIYSFFPYNIHDAPVAVQFK